MIEGFLESLSFELTLAGQLQIVNSLIEVC